MTAPVSGARSAGERDVADLAERTEAAVLAVLGSGRWRASEIGLGVAGRYALERLELAGKVRRHVVEGGSAVYSRAEESMATIREAIVDATGERMLVRSDEDYALAADHASEDRDVPRGPLSLTGETRVRVARRVGEVTTVWIAITMVGRWMPRVRGLEGCE